MNWFAKHRQDWIAETLLVYGFINRNHLMRKFGISGAAAALDFNAFNDANPDAMTYDNRRKTYLSNIASVCLDVTKLKSRDSLVREYLEAMDARLLARDGSCELTHDEAKKALRNVYLISLGEEPEMELI